MAEHQEALLYLQRELEEVQRRLAEMNQQQQEQHPAAVVFQNHLLRDREERAVSREAQRISQCDGEDASQLRRYFKDLSLVGVEQRIDVFRQTASGPLRWECERHLTDHPLLGWDEIEDHLLKAFISTDHQDRLKEDLRRVRQKIHETLLSYNRRFREMARDAFPFPRNQEQERELITLYGKGLAKNEVAKKLASRGWPQDLEAALRATETMEASKSVYDRFDRHEAMEIGEMTRQPQPQQPSQPSLDIQRLQSHVAKLEAKLDRMQHPPPSSRKCFNCGREGHLARNCRELDRRQVHASRAGSVNQVHNSKN
ncbi:hypothetical protein CAPTEDRAFT_209205 [Capitella teleta]|uniref:CCHC-type domain-containing protein n=1 Tax=Capitella teleta TaxID=283909 RepID=R7VJ34_CAPTE|nr:hypothetical protein CAPTEDRAFT_209205 [Capitella teleta]|eukprot:ELU18649.1 hypothetical protein CAPTEDRAFT_209205 [Capitella teleta]